MKKPYKDCSMCQRWLESWGDKKRTAREYWIDIDHSMSGPATVYYRPKEHTIHVKEVEDESFEETK